MSRTQTIELGTNSTLAAGMALFAVAALGGGALVGAVDGAQVGYYLSDSGLVTGGSAVGGGAVGGFLGVGIGGAITGGGGAYGFGALSGAVVGGPVGATIGAGIGAA